MQPPQSARKGGAPTGKLSSAPAKTRKLALYRPLIELKQHLERHGISVQFHGDSAAPKALIVGLKHAEKLREMIDSTQRAGKRRTVLTWLKEMQQGKTSTANPHSLHELLQEWLDKHASVPDAKTIRVVSKVARRAERKIAPDFTLTQTGSDRPARLVFMLKSEAP